MMISNLPSPLIMEHGQLELLNEDVISKLGTPLFFATPDLGRPYTQDARGKLYEIITGLYIIYHDYGIRFLSNFLTFTKSHLPAHGGHAVQAHYWSIESLRGGFVHGSLPDGNHAKELMRKLGFYFPGTSQQWPGILPTMTDQDCMVMVTKLTNNSDRLVRYIRDCANVIANTPSLLTSWKEQVLDDVLNENIPMYNGKYFDGRIVSDIVCACRDYSQPQHLVQAAVQQWLTKSNTKIKDGTLSGSNDLYLALYKEIYDLYHPSVQSTKISSMDSLLSDFDI